MTITSDNVKGALAALLLAGIAYGAYTYYHSESAQESPQPMSVEEALTVIDGEGATAAGGYDDIYKTALDENLPLFLAFLDYEQNISEDLVREYRTLFNRLNAFYSQDTPKQLVEGIFDVYTAGSETGYFTYMSAMEQLQQTVPASFEPGLSTAFANESCLVASERIHRAIMTEYYRPIIEAEQAEQARLQAKAEYEWQVREEARARILQDQAEARQRGQAKNAARNARAAERSRRYQQLVNAAQRHLDAQIRRDDQRRRQWQRWYFNDTTTYY